MREQEPNFSPKARMRLNTKPVHRHQKTEPPISATSIFLHQIPLQDRDRDREKRVESRETKLISRSDLKRRQLNLLVKIVLQLSNLDSRRNKLNEFI